MDKLIDLYNSIYEWYVGLWYSIFGEEGVAIIQGIMGIIFVVMCFMAVYIVVDEIDKYWERK